MPIEQQLTIHALTKWVMGEAVSTRDFERILLLLNSVPLQIEIANKDQIEGMYARLREVFKRVYFQSA